MQLAPVDWDSFTIGGGTPLLLNVGQLLRLFNGVFDELQVDAHIFKAIETSPSDTTAEKSRYCASLRLTVSVLVCRVLTIWNLPHYTAAMARQMPIGRWSCCAGAISILNIDIIYGILVKQQQV